MKFALLLAAALLAAGCQPAAESTKPTLSLADCRLPGLEMPALCGTLEAWEDRKSQAGRRIRIKIAVVPAKLRARLSDPVVVFAGGPGQGAVALAPQVMPLFARLNDARDIVFVDQRGTGGSHPLACPGDGPVPLQALFEDSLPLKHVTDCLKALDADPRHYLTTAAMADLEEIRAGLGYPKLNLWGGSYGTRAALEYLRRYPDRVRSAVLDGVAPSSMKLPLSFVADGEGALERLLNSCAKDPLCERTYPRLRQTIRSLRGELARRPMRAAITDPLTGERDSILVTENVFLSGLFRPLYIAELSSLLPYGIAAASAGDFNPLLAQNLEMSDEIAENLALGMHLSVICSEDVPRITPADLDGLSRAFFGRALVDDFMRACRIWPRGEVPADYYEPVRSNVPVLILSGGSDPATPPRHGEAVAAALGNATHLVADNLGHGVSQHGCAPRLVDKFIREGSAANLDGKCLQRIPRPMFVYPVGTAP